MRINNIGINTAFGRVIRLNAPPQKVEFSADDRDFGVLHELENVLNSRGSVAYTKNQANRIREFFKNILTDYNGENGIRIEKAFGDTVIISGEDAKKVKEMEEKYGISYRNISNRQKSRGKGRNEKAVKPKDARVLIAREIQKRNENETLGKPKSEINLLFKTPSKGKSKGRVDFSKFGIIEYSSEHCINNERKMEDSVKMGVHTVYRSISYEADKLEI